MPIPPSVSPRVVQGTYIDGVGNPQRGTITFRVDQPLIATVESWGIPPTPIQATLSTSGSFQITLLSSSDVDLFPSGFRYIVQERFNGGYLRTYSIELPASGDPLDLPTATQYSPGDNGLAIVHSINGRTGIVTLTPTDLAVIPLSQKAAALGVATLDSSGKIPVAQLPAGTSGVTTVDGRSGVVTLADLYATDDHTHTYPVTSVNGQTDDVSLDAADVGAVSAALLGANSGVATLDSGGKLLGAQVPSLAILDVHDAASQAAMLALPAQRGDIARRTDVSKTFVLTATDPAVLANWKELLTPPDAVASVNGQTGTVNLIPDDVGAVPATDVGSAGGVAALDLAGTVPVAQIPGLPGSKITSGLVPIAQLPTGTSGTTVALGNHTHAYVPTASKGAADGVPSLDGDALIPLAQIPGLPGSKISSGTVDAARLPTGTTAGTVATGDHTHAYIPTSQKNAANGVAPLDADGRVPLTALPLYIGRAVMIESGSELPANLPLGTLVVTYIQDAGVWTGVSLTGIWNGVEVLPVSVDGVGA